MAGSKRRRSSGGAAGSSQAARDSAHKIWLAGLGAFDRARTEGPRLFEALVAQGLSMGARAAGAADQALRAMRDGRGPQWEKVEKAFEERLARSLNRLGVLTRDQVNDLTRQVDEINRSLRAYAAKSAAGAGKRRKARSGTKRAGAKRSSAKRTAARRTRKARGAARRRAA